MPKPVRLLIVVGMITPFLFTGLTPAEAARLSSYFHFREPIFLQEKTLLQKVGCMKMNFMATRGACIVMLVGKNVEFCY